MRLFYTTHLCSIWWQQKCVILREYNTGPFNPKPLTLQLDHGRNAFVFGHLISSSTFDAEQLISMANFTLCNLGVVYNTVEVTYSTFS